MSNKLRCDVRQCMVQVAMCKRCLLDDTGEPYTVVKVVNCQWCCVNVGGLYQRGWCVL